jgi:hypothetical protein
MHRDSHFRLLILGEVFFISLLQHTPISKTPIRAWNSDCLDYSLQGHPDQNECDYLKTCIRCIAIPKLAHLRFPAPSSAHQLEDSFYAIFLANY